jgi:hypothetical protein
LLPSVTPSIGDNWVDNGDGSYTATGAGVADKVVWPSVGMVDGKDYFLQMTVDSVTSGECNGNVTGSGGFDLSDISSAGTYTVRVAKPAGSDQIEILGDASAAFTGTISNISVIAAKDLWTLNGTAKAFSPLAKWGDFPGSSGDYISTPDSTANSPTDDFATAFFGAFPWQTHSGDETLSSKFKSGGVCFMLRHVSGLARIDLSSTGGSETTVNATVPVTHQDNAMGGIMVVFDRSAETVTLYETSDSPLTPWPDITWTELEVITGASIAGTLFNGATEWQIGAYNSGGTNGLLLGKAAKAAIWKSTDYTATPDAQWDARSHTPGVSTAVCPDGATYTLNGNVSIEQNIPSPWDASGPLGYLSEQAGTNVCLQSEDLSTTWTTTRGTDTQNQAIAPDGSKTANKFVDGGGTSGQTAYFAQNVTVSSGSNTISIYAKSDQTDWLALRHGNFDDNGITYFDVGNGLVGTVDANHSDAGIEPAGNGWYRCWVVFSSTTDLAGAIELYLADADTDNSLAHAGSVSVLFWGAQVEAGSFPTTYIPTTSSSATRNADVLTYSATGNADSFPITVSAEATYSQSVNDAVAINTFVGSSNYSAMQLENATGKMRYVVVDGGAIVADIAASGGVVFGSPVNVTNALNTNDAEFYQDGVSSGTPDTSLTLPNVADTIGVGINQASGGQPNGTIRNVKIFNKRLNDSQVKNL